MHTHSVLALCACTSIKNLVLKNGWLIMQHELIYSTYTTTLVRDAPLCYSLSAYYVVQASTAGWGEMQRLSSQTCTTSYMQESTSSHVCMKASHCHKNIMQWWKAGMWYMYA